jgi:hypothetical protein
VREPYVDLDIRRIIQSTVLSGVFWDIVRACRRFRRAGLQINAATLLLADAACGGEVADTIAYQVDDRGLCRHTGVAARATVALPAPPERWLCISASRQPHSPPHIRVNQLEPHSHTARDRDHRAKALRTAAAMVGDAEL